MSNAVETKEENLVLTVTLNRPDKRNAFAPEMIRELRDIFKEASNSEKTRAILLQGRGHSFCAGADLEWMKSMANYSFEENLEDSKNLFDMFEVLYKCPLPIIGRAHGHVFGGALGLLAVCDIVAATDDTQFCFSEVRLGMAPAVISPYIVKKVPTALVHDWMLTGRRFDAEEALSTGLVNFIGDDSRVNQYVDKALARIKKSGPEAVRETKTLLREVRETPLEKSRDLTSKVIAERRASEEGQEGLAAFIEKRDPSWKLS